MLFEARESRAIYNDYDINAWARHRWRQLRVSENVFDLFVTLSDNTRQVLSRLANIALAKLCYRSHQFVNDFDVYLSSIEEHFFSFTKTQLISNYYTKLRSELRKMLKNYQNISNTRRDMIVLVARFERNNRIADVSTSQNNQERKNSRHNKNSNSK